MKIVHVIDYFYPQLGYQETFLAKTEVKQGHDVYVLTSNLFGEEIYQANQNILKHKKKNVGFLLEREIKTIRLSAIPIPLVNNLFLIGLEDVLTYIKPNIIICHGIASLNSIRLAKLKKHLINVKIIFDDHMTYHNTRGGIYNLIYYLFKKLAMPSILDSSDQMVAVTYETKDFMKYMYGIPEKKIEIIPLGVDTKLFRRDPIARMQVRSKYNIQKHDVVFIYVGKVIPIKGVHLFIEAALKIMKDFQSVKIMVVGGSFKRHDDLLKKRINSSTFKNNFTFIPVVPNEELYRYYSAADVGVWPFQCSITMKEALSCCVPIITSDDESCIPDMVGKGIGLVYNNGDLNDLIKKMEMLMGSEIRENMSIKAREFAENYDWAYLADKFLELIGINPNKY
jgi:glycosyltransferase involved in cell wall biosynthesis